MDYSLKNDVDGRDSFYVPRYEVKEIFFVIKQIGFVGLLSELIIYVCRYLFCSQSDRQHQHLIRRKSTLTTWGLLFRLGLCFRIRGHLDHLGHKKNFSLGRGEVTCIFSIDIRLIALLSGLSTTFLEKPSKPASH